jgi:hypothetical protein
MNIPSKSPGGKSLFGYGNNTSTQPLTFGTRNSLDETTKSSTNQEFQFEYLFQGSPAKRSEECDLQFEEPKDEDAQDTSSDSSEVIWPEQATVNIEDFELLKVVGKGGYGKVGQLNSCETSVMYHRINFCSGISSSSQEQPRNLCNEST